MSAREVERGEAPRPESDAESDVRDVLSELDDKTLSQCFSVITKEWFAPLSDHGFKLDLVFLAKLVFLLIR